MVSSIFYPPVDQPTLASGCYLTSIGAATHLPGQDYPTPNHPESFLFSLENGRRMPDWALILIVEGEGHWESLDARGPLLAGNLLFLPAQCWHRYSPLACTGWREQWLCLRGSHMRKLSLSGHLPTKPHLIFCDRFEVIRARMDRLLAEVSRAPDDHRLSWGARALSILLEACESTAEPREPKAEGRHPPVLRQALAYIERNSHRPITASDVAAICGCTRRTLERWFSASGETGVAAWITSVRIERAAHLLRASQLSIKEIAAETGFTSPGLLNTAFKRRFGRSPSRFRQECRG